MSFKNVDIESAMRRLAEAKIEEAMREGKFENLSGFGKPLNIDPSPAGENAAMAWWALRILKQQNFTPEEVQWRKQIDRFRAELEAATSERRVRAIVAAHNELIRQLNTLGTNAINLPMSALSLEHELRKLRERQTGVARHGETADVAVACVNDSCRAANPREARFCRRCGGSIS